MALTPVWLLVLPQVAKSELAQKPVMTRAARGLPTADRAAQPLFQWFPALPLRVLALKLPLAPVLKQRQSSAQPVLG